MSTRKPIHLSAERGQDAIWQGIRKLKTFTRQELIIHVEKNGAKGLQDGTVNAYISRLTKGGYLTYSASRVGLRGISRLHSYTLVKNTGVESPRLTVNGDPTVRGRNQENLWRTIKILGEFNYRELAIAAASDNSTIKETSAKEYIYHLKKAGYLHQTQPAHNGGTLARYRLRPSKNTGPRPPQIQRIKQVFDPNLNKVVWPPEREV